MTIIARCKSIVGEPAPAGARGAIPYEDDFYGWATQQAGFLASGEIDGLDLANLAEELAELARGEFRNLVQTYRALLLNVLKWDCQPEKRNRTCWAAIETQRGRVKDLLVDNPSLTLRLDEAGARGYREARLRMARETMLSLDAMPETCPYNARTILSRPFDLG